LLRNKSWKASVITVKYRTSDFKTYSKQRKVEPTNFDPDIFNISIGLLNQLHDGRRRVRLIGVGLSGFTSDKELPPDLFSNNEKQDKAMKALDTLRKKFGEDAIKIG
jgi:DNA polymerase IV